MTKPIRKTSAVKYCLLIVYLACTVFIHLGWVLCFGGEGHVRLECLGKSCCDDQAGIGFVTCEHEHSSPADHCGDCMDILPDRDHIAHARMVSRRLVKPADLAYSISGTAPAAGCGLTGVSHDFCFPLPDLTRSQLEKCRATTIIIC